MSKHKTGSIQCNNCNEEIKWLKFFYADILHGEKPEWREEDSSIEIDNEGFVKCPNCHSKQLVEVE